MRRRSTASDGRPPDLLAQPPSVRIQYFRDFAIAHPLLVEAKDRLLEAITESAPNSIVIVLGPTGVGKTTLLTKIRQLLGAMAAAEAPAESGRLAVVAIEATPPESRTFRGVVADQVARQNLVPHFLQPIHNFPRRIDARTVTPQL